MMKVRAHILKVTASLTAAMLTASVQAADLSIYSPVKSDGYTFTNFDGPSVGSGSTFINGISNNGTVVGFTSDGLTFNNFIANPLTSVSTAQININNSLFANANGINVNGTVVGSDGNNNAFYLSGSTLTTFVPNNAATPPNNGVAAIGFGINDQGTIVGQYTTNQDVSPGFVLKNNMVTTLNAPSGPDVVNAQGINNKGLVVGFYLGNDGQTHGFTYQLGPNTGSVATVNAIADPIIPHFPGEPGATFVFSQILGVNDHGIAVGYYDDSTGSQHGFLYNTNTGQYSFLDDPKAAFDNGVEITQITGINNSGEITGFYDDASGVAHGFVAFASVPEPSSIALLGLGLATVAGHAFRRRRQKAAR
jgi:probable HAF family extracellular repeat protein